MTEDPAVVLDSLASSRQLRGFVRAGRIDAMPAKRSRRLELLAAKRRPYSKTGLEAGR
jgi:hypothetical protein